VQLNGTDIGPGNGIKTSGREHTPEALSVLWFADDAGNLPPNSCPEPKTYLDLWHKEAGCSESEVLRRARRSLKAPMPLTSLDDVKKAVQHLKEAVYCRRLDMWVWAVASRAKARYQQPGSAGFESDKSCGSTRVKRILEIVAKHAKWAFLQGLTEDAAVAVADDAAAAARESFLQDAFNGIRARECASQQAQQAIAVRLEDENARRPLMQAGFLLQDSVWQAVRASAQIDVAHAQMHDALCSCIAELEALISQLG
jgi:hypothetical protein